MNFRHSMEFSSELFQYGKHHAYEGESFNPVNLLASPSYTLGYIAGALEELYDSIPKPSDSNISLRNAKNVLVSKVKE